MGKISLLIYPELPLKMWIKKVDWTPPTLPPPCFFASTFFAVLSSHQFTYSYSPSLCPRTPLLLRSARCCGQSPWVRWLGRPLRRQLSWPPPSSPVGGGARTAIADYRPGRPSRGSLVACAGYGKSGTNGGSDLTETKTKRVLEHFYWEKKNWVEMISFLKLWLVRKWFQFY